MYNKNTKTQETAIADLIETHGTSCYDYSWVKYTTSNNPINIFCNYHKKLFSQKYKDHKRGCGCPDCAKEASRAGSAYDQETAIAKLIEVHGTSCYDYSDVVYTKSWEKIKIRCKYHNSIFWQNYNAHRMGKGCQICAQEQREDSLRLSLKEVLARCIAVHGHKFDYSKAVYKSNRNPMEIWCPDHGQTFQTFPSHIKGHGCEKCADIAGGLKNTHSQEEAISALIEIHGDKYSYKETKYVSAKNDIRIFCNTCRQYFWQNYGVHIRGSGCPDCAKITREETKLITSGARILSKLKDKFRGYLDFSKSVYEGTYVDLEVECVFHGTFWKTPDSLLYTEHRCPDCAFSRKLSKEEVVARFIKRHGDKFDYSSFEYISAKAPFELVCPKHGPFWTTAANHYESDCFECSFDNKIYAKHDCVLNTETVIEMFREIWGNRYQYDKFIYIRSNIHAEIGCRKHGYFRQTPNTHYRSGCRKCADEDNVLTHEEALERLIKRHGNRYQYDKFIYSRQYSLIEIGCPTHGYFKQTFASHAQGTGCPDCNSIGAYSESYFEKHPEKKNVPATLYCRKFVHKQTGETFFKVGITTCKRFFPSTYQTILIAKKHLTLHEALQEQDLIEKFKHYQYIPDKFPGRTECFSRDILNLPQTSLIPSHNQQKVVERNKRSDANSLYNLGMAHQIGFGERCLNKAQILCEKAAQKGHKVAEALTNWEQV